MEFESSLRAPAKGLLAMTALGIAGAKINIVAKLKRRKS
jgi:hypothetical protein